jgi:hypothetical protein
MYERLACLRRADHYGELARQAKSPSERDRLLGAKRSYELLARSAEFGAFLDAWLALASTKTNSDKLTALRLKIDECLRSRE